MGVSVGFTVDAKDFYAQMRGIKREVQNASSDIKSSMKRGQKAIDDIGSSAKNAGNAIKIYLGAIGVRKAVEETVGSAIKLEKAFAGLSRTFSGDGARSTWGKQLESVQVGLREMSKTMPSTAVELSKIAEMAGQVGVKSKDLLVFTRTIADMANTTELSAEEATLALARFATIMDNEAGPQFDKIGSTIAALGITFAATDQDIVNYTIRMAAAGKQANLSEAEILAFGTAAASVGVQSEAGGTALSKIFEKTTQAVAEGGEMLKSFADAADMTAAGFKQAFEVNAAGAIQAFIEGIGRMNEQGVNVFSFLKEIDVDEARLKRTLLSLASAGDELGKTMKVANEEWRTGGTLAEIAGKIYASTSAQLDILANNLRDVGVRLGNEVLPHLRTFIANLIEITKSEAFERGIKNAAGEIADFAEALIDATLWVVKHREAIFELGEVIATVFIASRIAVWSTALITFLGKLPDMFLAASDGAMTLAAKMNLLIAAAAGLIYISEKIRNHVDSGTDAWLAHARELEKNAARFTELNTAAGALGMTVAEFRNRYGSVEHLLSFSDRPQAFAGSLLRNEIDKVAAAIDNLRAAAERAKQAGADAFLAGFLSLGAGTNVGGGPLWTTPGGAAPGPKSGGPGVDKDADEKAAEAFQKILDKYETMTDVMSKGEAASHMRAIVMVAEKLGVAAKWPKKFSEEVLDVYGAAKRAGSEIEGPFLKAVHKAVDQVGFAVLKTEDWSEALSDMLRDRSDKLIDKLTASIYKQYRVEFALVKLHEDLSEETEDYSKLLRHYADVGGPDAERATRDMIPALEQVIETMKANGAAADDLDRAYVNLAFAQKQLGAETKSYIAAVGPALTALMDGLSEGLEGRELGAGIADGLSAGLENLSGELEKKGNESGAKYADAFAAGFAALASGLGDESKSIGMTIFGAIGAAVGAYYGGAAGAATGQASSEAIFGMFEYTNSEKIADKASVFGLELSKELANGIAVGLTNRGIAADVQGGISLFISDILDEVALTANTSGQYVKLFREAVDLTAALSTESKAAYASRIDAARAAGASMEELNKLEKSWIEDQKLAQEALQSLNKDFPELMKAFIDAGQTHTQEFAQFIADSKELIGQVDSVTTHFLQQGTLAAAALNEFFSVVNISGPNATQNIADLGAMTEDLMVAMLAIPGGARAMAGAFGDALDALFEKIKAEGGDIPAALGHLMDLRNFFKDNSDITTALDALTAYIRLIGEAAGFSVQGFAAVQNQVNNLYDSMRSRGLSELDAIMTLAPALQQIINEHLRTGRVIDENTQKLINYGLEQGVLSDHGMDLASTIERGFAMMTEAIMLGFEQAFGVEFPETMRRAVEDAQRTLNTLTPPDLNVDINVNRGQGGNRGGNDDGDPRHAAGGYTGNRRGIVDPREFVFNAQATDAAGGPAVLEAIHDSLKAGLVPQGATGGGGGTMTVELELAPGRRQTIAVVQKALYDRLLIVPSETLR